MHTILRAQIVRIRSNINVCINVNTPFCSYVTGEFVALRKCAANNADVDEDSYANSHADATRELCRTVRHSSWIDDRTARSVASVRESGL